MSKHTPGPWTAHKCDDLHGFDHFVMTPSGFLGYLPKDSEGGGAQLFSKDDARLIAAAPEMLEALNACVADMILTEAHYGEHPAAQNAIERARAAIAKATGEP